MGSEQSTEKHVLAVPPSHWHVMAFRPLQQPPEQLPLQHSVPLVQGLVQKPKWASGRHAAAQVPPEQLPLQHWWFFLHFLPVGLHSSSAKATPPMPNDVSVPLRGLHPLT
jgi:hypothetical protein